MFCSYFLGGRWPDVAGRPVPDVPLMWLACAMGGSSPGSLPRAPYVKCYIFEKVASHLHQTPTFGGGRTEHKPSGPKKHQNA